MFVDLVDSTALSAALDPEEMGAAIRVYQNAVAGETLRFEGHIAKFMGDGVLAYFGWPQAHEDDAERAVRAGLALVQTVGALEVAGRRLAARIGIATGLVVVGESVGEGEAQERAVVGETPNLAARLQALAAPGSVVISQATRRLVGTSVRADRPRSDPDQGLRGAGRRLRGRGRRLRRWPLRGPPWAARDAADRT